MTNTTKITWMGGAMAVIIALIDYATHLTPDGVDLTNPVFWLGLGAAGIYALKAYFTQGTSSTPNAPTSPPSTIE